jgi:glucosamine kinase
LIGIDGGGTRTRARLQSVDGRTWGEGAAGPSGLSQGIDQAWRHIEQAVAQAFGAAGQPIAPRSECALGLGLAGAGQAALNAAFLAADPGYRHLVLDTDAAALLLGTHGDRRGIVIAAGTGSIGARRGDDGGVQLAGGWGFPMADEGGGAWLGTQAVRHAEAVVDGRDIGGALADRVLRQTGSTRPELQAWCRCAGQYDHAQLAPLVFEAAAHGDPVADALLQSAADELARLVRALQTVGGSLPIVLAGSVGTRLRARWPEDLRARCVEPLGDALDGALRLVRMALAGPRN